MPIHARKISVLGVWTPKRDWSSIIIEIRDPQKAHPLPEPRLHGDFGGDPSSGATWARPEEIKRELSNWVFTLQKLIKHDKIWSSYSWVHWGYFWLSVFNKNALCRLDWGKADKRLLYMLPSRRLCMDGNLYCLMCYFMYLYSVYLLVGLRVQCFRCYFGHLEQFCV